MAEAKRDGNRIPTLMAVSSSDGLTPVAVYADPTTHRLYVDLAGGGTVTTVSVVTAQGVSGSVADAATTPAITLALGALTGVTSLNGLVVTANTGAITTGSWAATAIPLSKGGTGADLSGVAKGGLIVGTAANTVAVKAVGTDGQFLQADAASTGGVKWATGVAGPGSSTDNAIARFDGAGGATLQDSAVTIGDAGAGSIAVTHAGDYNLDFANSGGDGYGFSFTGSNGTTNGSVGGGFSVTTGDGSPSGGNADGGVIDIVTGAGFGTGNGGEIVVSVGDAGATGGGGPINLYAGRGGATSGPGGEVYIAGGDARAGNSSGGDIILNPGTKSGSGTSGAVVIYNPDDVNFGVDLVTTGLTGDRVLTVPDATGTIALTADKLSAFAATTSAELKTVISDETGSGALVFATSPGFTTAANPVSSDGAALGTTALMWSDLFLASGGVINFNNGNYTLTHSAGALTANGALSIGTGNALTAGTIELGAASDTTLSRSAAGVLAVEGVVIPSISSTSTLTNKRVTRRVGTTASSATPTINTDNVDLYRITAQAAAITSFTTNLSGTPTDGQTLIVSITDDGTARAITWGASFESSGNVTLPTTTVVSTRLDVGFIWNTVTSKWRCVATA